MAKWGDGGTKEDETRAQQRRRDGGVTAMEGNGGRIMTEGTVAERVCEREDDEQ